MAVAEKARAQVEDFAGSPLRALLRLNLTALKRNHAVFLRFRHAVIVPLSQPVALLHMRFRMLNFCPARVSGIFFAVDRCQMRRVSVEIRSPDSKLRSVC